MGTSPSQSGHEWFEELCALAAIGELTASEFRELQTHLTECGRCRSVYSDFGRISSRDLGLLATAREPLSVDDAGSASLDEQELLGQLHRRARRVSASKLELLGPIQVVHKPSYRTLPRWMRLVPQASVAAAVLIVVAIGGYRLSEVRQRSAAEQMRSQITSLQHQTQMQADAGKQLVKQGTSERETLQKALDEAQTRYADLLIKHDLLQQGLTAANARVNQLGAELQAAKAQAEQQAKAREDSQQKLQASMAELDDLRRLESEANQRVREQGRQVADLSAQLQKARETIATNNSADDNEARELFGARDLHIVDVYDVDGNGKTRRTYGRVYYVQKRLLVFYAFDLQDKRLNRAAAGFQAWGYSEPNRGQPQNLGLFYVDDAAVNRWVLKVNNPRVLERVDAVFVTLEPPGGSPSPRGRRLLYANLTGAPNHP